MKRAARTEHRWPAVAAVLLALSLYAFLPTDVTPTAFRVVVIIVALSMLIPVIVLNPVRLNKQTSWSRRLSVGLPLLLALANYAALLQIVILLTTTGSKDAQSILVAAVQVWITNVIAFSLVYWELDRGGPVARRVDKREELPLADFRFPQDEDHDAITEVAKRSSATIDWTPSFIDYLYEAGVGAMAFSPGAAVPLSSRMKALILMQSGGGFVMLALIIAHAVGQIGA
ncbi:hypothetical protein AWU67_12155 [Microterricola viridarii]|uniref:DUF1345 domain-containing protein n=1 Tax=Microterricola viridarii TaxID=412690 RepID=A0A0Y0QAD1_9MICO|nr:hypothetical protein AWU67_12155 [Microterricola viridarii]